MLRIDEKVSDRITELGASLKNPQLSLFTYQKVNELEDFDTNFYRKLSDVIITNAKNEKEHYLGEIAAEALTYLKIMIFKYDVVVSNPPYTKSDDFGTSLHKFISDNYQSDYKLAGNLYSTFYKRNYEFLLKDGYMAMIHPMTFMYILFYCQILLPMIGTGVVFHFISILGTKGVTASSAAFILSLLAIVSFPTTFIAGYLLDKVKIHHATAFICAMETIALIILLLSTSTVTVIIFAIIHGITLGTQSVCGGIVWPEYYGVDHLGAIRGLAMTASVIASAIGPIPFGIIFDIKGTYTPAILLMIIFPAIGFLLALLSPKPKKAQ